jgi:uncharacterized protein YneF (UPF0154 family)
MKSLEEKQRIRRFWFWVLVIAVCIVVSFVSGLRWGAFLSDC